MGSRPGRCEPDALSLLVAVRAFTPPFGGDHRQREPDTHGIGVKQGTCRIGVPHAAVDHSPIASKRSSIDVRRGGLGDGDREPGRAQCRA